MDLDETEVNNDRTDMPSGKYSVSNWDIFHIIFSIVTHVIDIGFDIDVAVHYLLHGQTSYFIFTLILILLPSFINSVVSTQMHRQDDKKNKIDKNLSRMNVIKTNGKHMFILAFQITPVIRYYYCLKYALKARKCKNEGDQEGQRHYYILMLREDQDVALIRVFECFMEAAPQQILQMAIMIKHHHIGFSFRMFHQIASIVSSLVSMGWAMASYHRSIRLPQWNKSNISVKGMILQFFWHFLTTVSRIIAICAVACISVLFTGIFCLIHWLGMTIWNIVESRGLKNFCRDHQRPPHTPLTFIERLHAIVFACVLGIVYIFVFLNHDDGPTYYKHTLFYTLCFIENMIATFLWIFLVPIELRDVWYMNVIPVFCIVPFILGVISMIIYYKFFHPTSKNEFYFQNHTTQE